MASSSDPGIFSAREHGVLRLVHFSFTLFSLIYRLKERMISLVLKGLVQISHSQLTLRCSQPHSRTWSRH
jgi:hypothetical protein